MSAANLIRRRVGAVPVADPATLNVRSGGVVTFGDEQTNLFSSLLSRARTLGRPSRQTEYLHVSDLLSKCIRRIALLEQLKAPLTATGLSLAQSLTFAQGDAIHETVKHRIAISHPSLMWGNWTCRCGNATTAEPTTLDKASAVVCQSCSGCMTRYVEVPMRNEEYKIVGTPDVLTLIPEHQALHVTELKSISHDAWKELARADPEHQIQVLFYWYLMRELGYRVDSRVSIVYVTKGHVFKGVPWKEFTIDAQAMVEAGRLDPYLQEAAAIKAFRQGGKLPKRICQDAGVTQAKNCEACLACFGARDAAPIEVDLSAALARPTAIRSPANSSRNRPLAK